MHGTVIAVYNKKGGSTKTTTCATCAVALHELGHRPILMIDCDPNASLSTTFGVRPDAKQASLYEGLFAEGFSLESAIRPVREGLDLIPSTEQLAAAEQLIAAEPGGELILRDALKGLRDRYAAILIDTPPDVVKLNVLALVAADGVLVPMTTDFLAVDPTLKSLKIIRSVKDRLNPSLQTIGLLLTRYAPGNHAREVEERLRGAYPDLVFRDVVKESVRFKEAPIGQQTILDYDTNHPGAVAYRAVVKELLQRVSNYETTQTERATVS